MKRGRRIRIPTSAGAKAIDPLEPEVDSSLDGLVELLAGDGSVSERRRVRDIAARADVQELRRALDLYELDRRLDRDQRAHLARRRRLGVRIEKLLADPDLASARDVVPQLEHALGLLRRNQPAGPGAPRDDNARARDTLLRLAGVGRRDDRAFLVALLKRGDESPE